VARLARARDLHALVTGGAGFLGASLVDRLLAEGHTVDVVDSLVSGSLGRLADARRAPAGRFTFHQLDARSPDIPELIDRRRPEVVWHLAASRESVTACEQAVTDAEVNIAGTLRVAAGAQRAGARKIVVTSCGAALYGSLEPGEPPATERRSRRPSGDGIAAHAVDAYLIELAGRSGLVFTSLVLGTLYGPGDENGVVARWARALMGGEPCGVPGESEGSGDFVYIDDAVDALARAATRGDGYILNVGSGIETSFGEMYRRLAMALGVEAGRLLPLGSAGPAPARSVLDASRAADVLGWRAWTTLTEGLAAFARIVRPPPPIGLR